MTKIKILKLAMTPGQREYLEFLVNRRLGDLKALTNKPRANPEVYNNEVIALSEIKLQLKNATE